jgi:hypothetical protein
MAGFDIDVPVFQKWWAIGTVFGINNHGACRGAAFGQSGMPKMVTLEPAAGKSQILAFLAILLHHENRALTGDIGCLARLGTIGRPLAHIS